ncbi:hypothetical protein BDY19DRAFT_532201 [Irpex rosettiformis]|uniref:Uncharacterized protein n=1 Tax=Irpex rosettiformis TaxID=378272 RepID=A0ACB8TR46_9APHY|nr:hypothetical protein BDY19DRAFT_532201 [Irpex rosettiformis]
MLFVANHFRLTFSQFVSILRLCLLLAPFAFPQNTASRDVISASQSSSLCWIWIFLPSCLVVLAFSFALCFVLTRIVMNFPWSPNNESTAYENLSHMHIDLRHPRVKHRFYEFEKSICRHFRRTPGCGCTRCNTGNQILDIIARFCHKYSRWDVPQTYLANAGHSRYSLLLFAVAGNGALDRLRSGHTAHRSRPLHYWQANSNALRIYSMWKKLQCMRASY